MKFEVRFTGIGPGCAIRQLPKRVGIEFLDQVREILDMPALPAKIVESYVNGCYLDPVVELPEAEARESGLFRKRTKIDVKVMTGMLSKYCFLGFRVNKDKDGKVTRVVPEWKVLEEDIWSDWACAGWPLEWGLMEDTDDGD